MLQFIFLLDGIGIGGALDSVDELICKALGGGLGVPETRGAPVHSSQMA
jgi:hypothetical protein